MLRFYRYFYYRLYAWNLKTWGEEDMPQWNAMLGVSFMMFVNFCTLGILLQIFGLVSFLKDPAPKVAIVVIITIFLFVNYFQYVHNGKFFNIAEEFKNEPRKKRVFNALLLWLYVIGSLALSVVLAMVLGKAEGLR